MENSYSLPPTSAISYLCKHFTKILRKFAEIRGSLRNFADLLRDFAEFYGFLRIFCGILRNFTEFCGILRRQEIAEVGGQQHEKYIFQIYPLFSTLNFLSASTRPPAPLVPPRWRPRARRRRCCQSHTPRRRYSR